MQCYNPERGKIPTPNIDRIPAEGMRFTDAHSSSAVCSPSRYTLLTGRYHWRTRLPKGIVGRWAPPVIPPNRLTVASLAKQAGYNTACIGKWHLGWNWAIAEADKELFLTGGYGGKKEITATGEHRQAWAKTFSQPIEGGPIANGFDTYFGTDGPNWPPYCFIENDRTVGIPSTFANIKLFEKNQASVQGPAIEDWTLEPILPELGNRAAVYIKSQSKNSAPYLLYMPLTSPHTPIAVNDVWKGKSGLRGYKSDAWEGGHRVPFIVRWPGVVAQSSVNEQRVHQADLFATLADVFDQTIPENAGEDSVNMLPALFGEPMPPRPAIIHHSNSAYAMREGDWEIVFGRGEGRVQPQEGKGYLFNLKTDPYETNDLWNQPRTRRRTHRTI